MKRQAGPNSPHRSAATDAHVEHLVHRHRIGDEVMEAQVRGGQEHRRRTHHGVGVAQEHAAAVAAVEVEEPEPITHYCCCSHRIGRYCGLGDAMRNMVEVEVLLSHWLAMTASVPSGKLKPPLLAGRSTKGSPSPPWSCR